LNLLLFRLFLHLRKLQRPSLQGQPLPELLPLERPQPGRRQAQLLVPELLLV
jgi:hypothetical protein